MWGCKWCTPLGRLCICKVSAWPGLEGRHKQLSSCSAGQALREIPALCLSRSRSCSGPPYAQRRDMLLPDGMHKGQCMPAVGVFLQRF